MFGAMAIKIKDKMTGLFFGSFNPVHSGHLQIAQKILAHGLVKKIGWITSPQSPAKSSNILVNIQHRIQMVLLAIQGEKNMYHMDVECFLPIPNITCNTLLLLKKKYPQKKFRILLGEDNLESFHTWENFRWILHHFSPIVYPRTHHKRNDWLKKYPTITWLHAWVDLPIASTTIRQFIQTGQSIQSFVPQKVEQYIIQHRLFGI